MLKRIYTILVLCLLMLPATQMANAKDTTNKTNQIKAPKIFNAKTHTLDNGLQIIVVENDRSPVVTHMLWYKVGAADEPQGQSGIAHFLEHLLFKGHKYEGLGSYEPGEFSKIVRKLGGEDNAFTSQDYTAYYQSVAKEHLEKMMTIEAARMKGLNVPEKDIASENKVIQEERRQRTDNNPGSLLSEQLKAALFPNHPYSIPVIGWMHEVKELNKDQIMGFYNRFYAPNNALLIISGDVTAQDVFDMAKRTYGILPSADTPKRKRTTSPPFISDTLITLHHKNVKEPVYKKIYRVPSHRQNADESLAFEVLEEIMGGGSTSRLYKSLVIDKKLATNIGFSYQSAAWNDSTLGISATPSSIDKIEELEQAIKDELRKLIKNGITDEELSDSITRMQADAIYARDSLSGPAMIIGYNIITGSSLDDIENWPEQISHVTKDQVQAVANKYLNPDMPFNHPPVTGLLLPKELEAPKEGAE